jgi:sorbitol/mannitol transport system substrate-binding protein
MLSFRSGLKRISKGGLMKSKILSTLFPMLFVILCCIQQSQGAQTVRLVTADLAPYIGEELEDNGYVYELVTEAFKRVGYKVEIEFFPLARAKKLAEEGARDGLMPVYYDPALEGKLAFSNPFPGGRIGLLKKKSLNVDFKVDPTKDQIEALKQLKAYRFGFRRGAVNTKEFDNATFLKKSGVTTDSQNLLKLFLGRIDFAIIDKYTAAYLMVEKFPHMIGQIEFMEPPLGIRSFHLAFSRKVKGFERRLADFNRGLQEITNDKTLAFILYKYGFLEPKTSPVEKKIIRIGSVDNHDMVVMWRLSKEYEVKHPDIQLEWQFLDENILRRRLMESLAIGDAGRFSIMTIGAYEAPIWAERKWIVPLKGFPEGYDLQDIIKPLRDILSYNGELYALPFYAESAMTYYRKDLFQEAGIKMPAQPTYEDIEKAAAALNDPAKNVYGICLRGKPGWGENMAFLTLLVNTFGGHWFDENWYPTIDTPQWRQAITFYKNLLTKYGPPHASRNGFSENLDLFAEGKCGMWIDATVAAGKLYNPKESKVADRVGFAASPVIGTPNGSHWLWTWALAIPSSSDSYQEALDFITWATSKEYIKLVAKSEGWVSVPPGTRISTYENSSYKREAPFSGFVLAAIQNVAPKDATLKRTPYQEIQLVTIPEFAAIGDQVGKLMGKILDGKISIDKALKQSQELVYNQMENSGYIK